MRRRFTLDDYAYERAQQFTQYGAACENVSTVFIDVGEPQVTIRAELLFGRQQQALLEVLEIVALREGKITRIKYGYHFQYRDALVVRFDRDPIHQEAPEHKHLGANQERRIPCDRVTLSDVVDYVNDVLPQLEAADRELRFGRRWLRRGRRLRTG